MPPTQQDLWKLAASQQQGIIATINSDDVPQMSNVLYVPDSGDRVIRFSTTADRVKARNLTRDPRAALHVGGDDFWQYAVVNGQVAFSNAARATGGDAIEELYRVHAAFYGDLNRADFAEEMVRNKRLVVRLHATRLCGVLARGGRRPVTESA